MRKASGVDLLRDGERIEAKRKEEAEMKVLVAVDDSRGSHHALAWVLRHLFLPAAAEKEQDQEAPELVLVHAQEPLHYVMYPVGPGED